LLAGSCILICRGLLRASTALAGGGGLSRSTLLSAQVRQSERADGLIVNLPGGLKTLLALERSQGLNGGLIQHAVRLVDVEPFLDQHRLHLPDLLGAEIKHGCAAPLRSAMAGVELRTALRRRSYGDDRDDLTALVDDDDVVTRHEEPVTPELRENLDERWIDVDDAHAGRDHRADRQREVHVIDARQVAASKHRLLNSDALVGRQIHSAADLTLLRLTLLSLALRSRGLLNLARLSLVALWALPLSLIVLLALALWWVLALIARSLTGGLIARRLTLLGLALHALVTLTLLALFLLALLGLALHTLVTLTLLALFLLALLALALLGLALHALVTLTLLALFLLALLGLALRALVALALAGRLLPLLLSLAALGSTLLGPLRFAPLRALR